MRIQSLEGYMDKMIHPLKDRIFGALIEGNNLVFSKKGELKTEKPVTKSKIAVVVCAEHPSSPENWMDNHPVRNLPGLQGLHMVGQWTAPYTGTLIAALTGRQMIELLCKEEKRKFKTSIV